MGTYTSGNYKFYKPDPTDLVDPVVDIQNNFNILDKRIWPATRYNVKVNRDSLSLNMNDYEVGTKVLDQQTGQIMYRANNGMAAFAEINNTFAWNNIVLTAGVALNPSSWLQLPAWRYLDGDTNRIELKGQITGSSIPTNTVVFLTSGAGSGGVPAPATNKYFSVQPGCGNFYPNVNVCARISIDTTGVLAFCRYGPAAPGTNQENYLILDNIIYELN